MNELLILADKWLTELGIKTQVSSTKLLMINRDDVDALYTPVAIYDEFLKEIRAGVGTNKFYFESKDREWLYLNTF
jgi:hypothetical protein